MKRPRTGKRTIERQQAVPLKQTSGADMALPPTRTCTLRNDDVSSRYPHRKVASQETGHMQPSHKLDKNWRPRHWGTGSPYNDAQVSKVSKPITDEGEFKRRTGKPTDPIAGFFGTNHVYHGMGKAEQMGLLSCPSKDCLPLRTEGGPTRISVDERLEQRA